MRRENRRKSIRGRTPPKNLALELWVLRLLVQGQAWESWSKYIGYDIKFWANTEIRGMKALGERVDDLAEKWEKKKAEVNSTDTLVDEFGGRFEKFAEFGLIEGNPLAVPFELVEGLKSCEEEAKTRPLFNVVLGRNLELLGRLFELTPTAQEVLAFFIFMEKNFNFCQLLNVFDYASSGLEMICEVVACAIDRPVEEVRKAFTPEGGLVGGLLRLKEDPNTEIEEFVCLGGIMRSVDIFTTPLTEESIVASRFTVGKEPELTLSDYGHVPLVKSLLLPYLTKAIEEKRTGVNVLLYGEPGTGKTQLSRVDHWKTSVRLLNKKSRALVAIDEAEDIFTSGVDFFGEGNTSFARRNKALINKLLETNPCPTIWMTNSLKAMDSAMLRRFDVVFEVPQPTTRQRREMIGKLAGETLSSDVCERLSQTEDLSPAVITRALKVTDAVCPAVGGERDALMARLVDETLRAQGVPAVTSKSEVTESVYSLDFVNTDVDLQKLIDGIARRQSARLCLYGAPGTGKSAYAKKLAEELNKPLVAKKASDFLDCYVGQTEANIARTFREAETEGAVLLLDEADSFLQDRSRSRATWEVTQVNEMLTQIERFTGILVVTTNIIDMLDAASIRRFDIKVKFDCLTGAQSQALFETYAKRLGLTDRVDESILSRARALSLVTPGDFAAVVRQAGFNPLEDALDFVKRLEAECALKEDNKWRRIGFS